MWCFVGVCGVCLAQFLEFLTVIVCFKFAKFADIQNMVKLERTPYWHILILNR